MSNIRDFITDSWPNIKVKVLTADEEIGNMIRNEYQISYKDNLVEAQETISPDMVVEKFLGKNGLFICALAISLTKKFGDIQFCYKNRHPKTHGTEIVVYYTPNNILDEEVRERMMFFHTQQNLDFEYIDLDKLAANSNSYFKLKYSIGK